MHTVNHKNSRAPQNKTRHRRHFSARALSGTLLALLVAASLSGCRTTTPDDNASTSPTVGTSPSDFGSPINHAELCQILGSDSITQLATQHGYGPGAPEQSEPGTCAQYPTRFEGDVEKETITVLSTADIWSSAQDAEAAFEYWNDSDSNSYRLRLPFPESEKESILSGAWDEAVMVADPEWDHSPQFKIMARSGGLIVFYHITLSVKGSEELCSESLTTSCVISPEIVDSWVEADLLPRALASLREEGLVPE